MVTKTELATFFGPAFRMKPGAVLVDLIYLKKTLRMFMRAYDIIKESLTTCALIQVQTNTDVTFYVDLIINVMQ